MSQMTPAEIATAAERIYDEKYRREFERKFHNHHVVIDVKTGEAYRGRWPEDAMQAAIEAAPKGHLHLIRIGSPGALRVSYTMGNARTRTLSL